MTRKKSGILLWALLTLHAAALTQTPSKLSLKECVETALKNNIPVKQTGLLADRDEIYWKQARANRLPDLNGNFNYGWSQGRTIDPITNGYVNQQLSSSNLSLSSSIILFSGLQLKNAIQQNLFAFQSSKMEWEQAKNTLTLNVLLTYLLVLNNEDILEISKAQEAVTRTQVDRLALLVKEGAVGPYQLTDLKGQLASDQVAIVNNNNSLQSSKLSLCQLMNIPYNKDLQFDRDELKKPTGLYELSAEEVYRNSLEGFAEVKATDLRVKSFETGIKVAKSNYYPTLRFGGNLGSSYSSAAQTSIPTNKTEVATGDYVKINNAQFDVLGLQQNYNYKKPGYGTQFNDNLGNSYGFTMAVPIFNNLRTRNQVKLANIDYKNAELENENIKLKLRQNVEQAHLNMTSSYEKFKALEEQVSNFEESFKSAQIRFNNGVINSVEYLLVKNSLDRAKVSLITSMYDYIVRTKVLDYYQVKLVW